jgi:hypothetical protein
MSLWPDLEPLAHAVHLDGSLVSLLHDRGVVNEDALLQVFRELGAGQPLTRDHLVQIFGVAPVYALMTTHDETARQLVREARDAMFNQETVVNLKDWLAAANAIVPE